MKLKKKKKISFILNKIWGDVKNEEKTKDELIKYK